MKKTKQIFAKFFGIFALTKLRNAFCNIAEGTHAGNITMIAGEDIDTANLVVAVGTNENEIVVCGASARPLGVCNDQGSKGDILNVAVSGSAESTFVCVCSSGANCGDALYTAANGKVSTTAANGAFKVGNALCSCAAGGIVEVDSQGFGNRAWQIAECGVFAWTGSTASETMTLASAKEGDLVFASIAGVGGSEKSVVAIPSNGSIAFTLDANGTASTTKISWIIVRKN